MAKKANSSLKTTGKKGTRGPAQEIRQGSAGIGKTQAGKKRSPIKGSVKAASKVPGAVKGY